MTIHRLLACALVLATSCASEDSEAPAPAPEATAAPAPAPAPAEPPKPQKAPRRFLVVEGDVRLDGAPASVDQAIGDTAKIDTGKEGRAVLTLQPGSVIEVRQGSKLSLGSSPRKKTSVQLLAGTLWSFLPSGEASYEVATQNAVAGVRGTIFYVEAPKPNETYVCACDGEVEVSAGQKNLPRNVTSKMEHKSFLVRGNAKKAAMKDAKLRGHTKEQAAELEKLIEQTR